MLSLLNGSTLGFDLVRLRNGPLVADIVLGALAVRPGDVGQPPAADVAGPFTPSHGASGPPSAVRLPHSDLPDGARVHPPGQLTPRDPSSRGSSDGQSDTSLTALASQLCSTTIGSLEALVAMLRREVFGWTWESSEGADGERLTVRSPEAGELQTVCLAAISAAYGAPDLSDRRVAEAVERWYGVRNRLPRRSVPLGPQQLQLAVLLARIQALQPHEVRDVLDTYHRHQPAQLWAPAVHEATWAAYLSGRVAAAAAAQLHLVAAVRSAGVSLDDVAAGFWNAVSGAVSALVVQDLLDDVSCDLLLARYPVLTRAHD